MPLPHLDISWSLSIGQHSERSCLPQADITAEVSQSHSVAFLNLPDDAQIKIDDKKLAISDNGADILYWSPSAAVINDHKCSVLKQHLFILLQF